MASHFKWYPSTEEEVVPWNAQFEFPTQANKAVKITPRIPPKNGATFAPGSTIRLEFPAQGYINPANTTVEFDVILNGFSNTFVTGTNWGVWFQNNIQSVFDRLRIMYGSTPVEDIIHPNLLVRQLTEFTTSNGVILDQTSVAEGIAGVAYNGNNTGTAPVGFVNARQNYIQGLISTGTGLGSFGVPNWQAAGVAPFNTMTCIRRYQIQLPAGLFQQGKVIPVKFMASQFAIELTLAQPASCIMACGNLTYNGSTLPSVAATGSPSYSIQNVNLIPEVLEYDTSYDQEFLMGLATGGVPIQFSSWHNFQFNVTGSTGQFIIQERSRSVKAIFGFLKLQNDSIYNDAGATFSDVGVGAFLNSYQFRIGSRYLPASPVICSGTDYGKFKTGGAESYLELQKCLNMVGDYRLSSNTDVRNWGMPLAAAGISGGTPDIVNGPKYVNTGDYALEIATRPNADGSIATTHAGSGAPYTKGGTVGSTMFAFCTSTETTNGKEISGLNAEEQSDIALTINWATAPTDQFTLEVFTYFDAMMVLRENNIIQLIF